MKIWLVPNQFLPTIGGVQIAVESLSKAFLEKGHNVTILTSRYPKGASTFEIVDNIVIYRFSFSIYRDNLKSLVIFLLRLVTNITRLVKIYLETKPDLVNVHYVDENAFYLLLLRYIFRFPLVINAHGSDVLKNPKHSKILKMTLKEILRKADHVISNSVQLLSEIENYSSQVRSKATIIPNGVNINDFKLEENSQGRVYPYVVSVGRLVKEKGFDILIRSLRDVAMKYPEYKLLIIGDGIEKDTLRKLVEQLGVVNNVIFLGKMDHKEVLSCISESSFLVLPSRREAFGIVLIEAMAAGKAVIATNVGGVPEFVVHGENGILVKPEDPASMSKAVSKLIQYPDLARKMGETGRKMVENRFEWDSIANQYLEIYTQVLAKKLVNKSG